ncbi:hypothetical protein AAK882_06775 [Carnobacteriaceae bacterium 52-44]
MILEKYLKQYDLELGDVLGELNFTAAEVQQWKVIQYPDELLYKLSKRLKMDVSRLLYELLYLENAGDVRKTSSDYGLLKALETKVTYIFIPQTYRKEQSSFLRTLLIEKNIFELEQIPLTKYNLFGQQIFQSFLSLAEKDEDFKRIEKQLVNYFVLVHDTSGSLLCHADFLKESK